MKIKAIFFDFDGTIIDSEPLYRDFWKEACRRSGYDLKDENHLYLRSLDHTLAEKYLKSLFGDDIDFYHIRKVRRELMNEYLKDNVIPIKTGARTTLKHIHDGLNIPCYIVSSSSEEYVEKNCKDHHIFSYIDGIISVHGLPKGKPFPYVYLEALKKSGFNADEVVVIEDSPNGVKSASSAHIKTIFIKDMSEADEEVKKQTIAQLKNINELIKYIKENLL